MANMLRYLRDNNVSLCISIPEYGRLFSGKKHRLLARLPEKEGALGRFFPENFQKTSGNLLI